jgi:hypothetical protein
MVNLDQLMALDLLIWLRTSERAAGLAHTNQSTISRRSRAVLDRFELRLSRRRDGWQPAGDTHLLMLERQVHQQARFLGRQPLRLHVPYWTRCLALHGLPDGWCANPAASTLVCESPVALLRERVIDACLVTPTQLPACTDGLLLLDLYSRPIALTLFHQGRPAEAVDRFRRQRDRGALCLRRMPFLPESCVERSRDWLGLLTQSAVPSRPQPDADLASVAFLTPEMREVQQASCWVEEGFEPFPYTEWLVVLAENAQQAAVERLQEHLQALFTPVAR